MQRDTGASTLVLLVGSDAPTRAMVRFLLAEDGWQVTEAATILAGLSGPQLRDVGLVAAICAEAREDAVAELDFLRRLHLPVPELLLVRGADAGLRRRANACGIHQTVDLPSAARELQLAARKAFGEHRVWGGTPRPGSIHAGGLTLCTARRTVASAAPKWTACLTKRETALLGALMRAPGQAIAHQRLIDLTWGVSTVDDGNGLAVLVRRLRQADAAGGAAWLHSYHAPARLRF